MGGFLAKKVKLTKNQQAWNRAYRNLQSRVKRAEKRGYILPSFEMTRPSRVTKKMIAELNQLRGISLLRLGTYNLEGQPVSGAQGYRYEQARAAERRKQKINEDQLIIDNLLVELNNRWFGAGPTKYRLINFINRVVMEYGGGAVARILKRDADMGAWEVTRDVAYNFDGSQDRWINHILQSLGASGKIVSDFSSDTDDGIPLGDMEEVWTE